MQKQKRQSHSLSLWIFLLVLITNTHSAEVTTARVENAWQAVRAGEAAILMRHALAPGVGDPADFDLQDCSTQRNLSEAGREQAMAIGEVLRNNGIAKATILSSQWCRCMETARLLNLSDPEPTPMLNSFFQNRHTAESQTERLKESLRQWFENKNEVKVLLTHQVNISALSDTFASSGDMVIVSMKNDEPEVLAIISTK